MLLALVLFSAQEVDLKHYGPWTREVSKRDDKGIEALYTACDKAAEKGDLNAMAELHDYPLVMVTDDKSGEIEIGQWDRAEWIEQLKVFFATQQPAGTKHDVKKTIFYNSPIAATVIEEHTQSLGKTSQKWITTAVLTKREGKWRFRTMFEAGWGGDIVKH